MRRRGHVTPSAGRSGRSRPGGAAAPGPAPPSGTGRTLLDALAPLLPGASRRTLRQIIEHGRVLVDGEAVRRAGTRVADGAMITVLPRAATREDAPAPLPVLFEDAHLLIVDKPAGLLTAAPRSGRRESAWSRVRRMFRGRRPEEEAHLVHRLDERASGALLFAKTEGVQTALKEIFARHDLDRHYAAIVSGKLRSREGEFRSRLVELDERMHRVRSVRPSDPRPLQSAAREAVTRYKVLGEAGGLSAIEVRLETGRKHQIRVHLAEAGHPVLGDGLYGGADAGRLFLHAWLLGFVHPVTKRRVRAVSRPGAAFEERVPGAFRSPSRIVPR